MATTDIKDASGLTKQIQDPLAPGRAAATASRPVVAATEDKAVMDAQAASLVTLAALSKAEDAAHASGDPGVQILTVRGDAAAATAGTDGDYQPLRTDASGRLWVNVGTLAALPAGSNNIGDVDVLTMPGQFAEDTSHASGNTGNFILTVRADTAASTAGSSGDYSGLMSDSAGRVWANVDASAIIGALSDAAWTSGNGSVIAVLKAIATSAADTTTPVTVAMGQSQYETVAASQTDQILGTTGAAGDYLAGLLVIPATTSPGAVSIEDGATNIPVFVGGASSVSNLVPFFIPLGISSVSGGWEITTGTNVSVIGVGDFT